MLFFYVLINSVTWKLASKLVSNSEKYDKTLNRYFNKLIKTNIFNNLRILLTNNYINETNITQLKIDSTFWK